MQDLIQRCADLKNHPVELEWIKIGDPVKLGTNWGPFEKGQKVTIHGIFGSVEMPHFWLTGEAVYSTTERTWGPYMEWDFEKL